ncbi:MAG: DUF262 domain-containing protein [bacterium]|nr:DUF262 domain-containing protein [bacterium]
MARQEDIPEELAADGTAAGVEIEEDPINEEPFDPSSISFDPKNVPMDTLIRRLRQDTIRLAPPFQRNKVWDATRRSRLIESLMLRIPLPMFYVAANEDGNWDVVDGLQRLSAIYDFILGPDLDGSGSRLTGLEFWGNQFNDKTFKEIADDKAHARIVNNIMETEMRFTVINPGTPEEVKRNIFKRINTGGMPLTSQEIRHALYQGKATKLLKELRESSLFNKAINGAVQDSRMAAQELILRFLAFSLQNSDRFDSSMDTFLSDTMRIINSMPELRKKNLEKIFKNKPLPELRFSTIKELEKRFATAMERGSELFGEYAFRKSLPDQHKTPINKALFETWGNILADLSEKQYKTLLKNKDRLFKEYLIVLKDIEFERAVSREGARASGVQFRYKRIQELIKTILKGA